MRLEQLLSLGALSLLLFMTCWFALIARLHFSTTSPRRPSLFFLEALSFLAVASTVFSVVYSRKVSIAQSSAAIFLGCMAGLLFFAAVRATRGQEFGVVFGGTVPKMMNKSGPYKYIRHPLYAAYVLNWVGCAVLSYSLLTTAAVATIAGMYWMAARGEERDLLGSELGDAYEGYRLHTGLFLPRIAHRASRKRDLGQRLGTREKGDL